MSDRLKCKFCDWSTLKAFKVGGKFKGIDHAHERLTDHVFDKHPAEYSRIQDALDGESA